MKLDFTSLTQPVKKQWGQWGQPGTRTLPPGVEGPNHPKFLSPKHKNNWGQTGTTGDTTQSTVEKLPPLASGSAICPQLSPEQKQNGDKQISRFSGATPGTDDFVPNVPNVPTHLTKVELAPGFNLSPVSPVTFCESNIEPFHASGNACADCKHLLKGGTCAEPVSAGLVQSFGIVWPPEGHGATCAAFGRKPTDAPISASPYLSKASADRCHTPEWTEAEMFTFTTRLTRFVRIGLQPDADHLAELLTLRDRDGDDRRMCFECQHYRPWRCGNHTGAGLQAPDMSRDLAGLLQRCPGFIA